MNRINNESLFHIFNDEKVAKSFIDTYFDLNKARAMLTIDECLDLSESYGVPSVAVSATNKQKYKYKMYIHIIEKEHLNSDYHGLWGSIMLESMNRAKKYNPMEPVVHLVIANHQWIDQRDFDTSFNINNPNTSRYFPAKLVEVQVIELPKMRKKFDKMRPSTIVKTPIYRWYVFLDNETEKPLLRETINKDDAIFKANELCEGFL